jgi:hypothetical protein
MLTNSIKFNNVSYCPDLRRRFKIELEEDDELKKGIFKNTSKSYPFLDIFKHILDKYNIILTHFLLLLTSLSSQITNTLLSIPTENKLILCVIRILTKLELKDITERQ